MPGANAKNGTTYSQARRHAAPIAGIALAPFGLELLEPHVNGPRNLPSFGRAIFPTFGGRW